MGAQIARIHAGCRKFAASLPASQRRMQYMFQAESDGFDFVFGESFGHISWQNIAGARETKHFFVLIHKPFFIRVLPKRGFLIRDLLISRLGKDARLSK
jgi:hypothetical protein